jgi:hypothetical protein
MPDADLYRRFAERFHAGMRVRPAAAAQVEAAEAALGVLWSEAYRRFALACGALYCPALLDRVVERKPGYSDVQQFFTPTQAVTETLRARLEPAGASLAFADDSLGNLFAYRGLPAAPPRPGDAAVWLIDHENDEVGREAESFVAWLDRFLNL